MTQHVHLDVVGGIAGDMFIAAMLDAYPDSIKACMDDLADSGVLEHVRVSLQPGKSHGLAVKRLEVRCTSDTPRHTGTYKDIKSWLQHSALDDAVKGTAQEILWLLASAESHVHGVALDAVHFHEVADWDSLADVVAAASVIQRNPVTRWSCSSLPLGSGLVQTEHGQLPVPAPATLYLLQGIPVHDDGEAGERVTPTGAAIVKYLWQCGERCLTEFSLRASGICQGMGVGAGQRELQGRPNIVRCTIILPDVSTNSVHEDAQQIVDEIDELRFFIDDMTPEELAVSLDYIRASEGVLDVTFNLGMGKKERAVFDVCVLCDPAFEHQVSHQCFAQTSTIGMRVQRIRRRTLARQTCEVVDGDGAAGIKQVRRGDETTAKVESDDLRDFPTLAMRRARASAVLAEKS